MFIPNGPLMGTKQPPFQQRGYAVWPWKNDTIWILVFGKNAFNMLVTVHRQIVVTAPTVGLNYRSRLYNTLYKTDQTGAGDIGDLLETYPAKTLGRVNFNGYSNNRFCLCFSAICALFLSPDIRLVNLDMSLEHVTARAYHSTSQLVQPGPSSLITAQPKNSLETQSTDTEFLIGYIPHGLKPYS